MTNNLKNTINFEDLVKLVETKQYDVIEFFGLPGSGKTTLSKQLKKVFPEKILSKEDFSVFHNYLYIVNFRSFFKKIFVLKSVFLKNKYTPSFRVVAKFLKLINRLIFSKKRNKILVLDHGVIQEFIKHYDNPKLKQIFLDLMEINFFENGKSYLFLCIPDNKKVCIEREMKRKKLPWKNPAELHNLYNKYETALLHVLKIDSIVLKIFKKI